MALEFSTPLPANFEPDKSIVVVVLTTLETYDQRQQQRAQVKAIPIRVSQLNVSQSVMESLLSASRTFNVPIANAIDEAETPVTGNPVDEKEVIDLDKTF